MFAQQMASHKKDKRKGSVRASIREKREDKKKKNKKGKRGKDQEDEIDDLETKQKFEFPCCKKKTASAEESNELEEIEPLPDPETEEMTPFRAKLALHPWFKATHERVL